MFRPPDQQQRLGLAPAERREVAQRQVDNVDAGGGVSHERRTPVREGPGTFVGPHAGRRTVEDLVVRVADHDRVAILSQERDVPLVPEVDDLFVAAAADEDRDARARRVGHEVHGALNSGEVAGAVCGDDDARGIGWRRSGTRRNVHAIGPENPEKPGALIVAGSTSTR